MTIRNARIFAFSELIGTGFGAGLDYGGGQGFISRCTSQNLLLLLSMD